MPCLKIDYFLIEITESFIMYFITCTCITLQSPSCKGSCVNAYITEFRFAGVVNVVRFQADDNKPSWTWCCPRPLWVTHFLSILYKVRYSFIHSVFCLTTGPKPPPKRFLHILWSRASSFKWEYPLLSLRSSSSSLHIFPRLLVTSNSASIIPLITCFRRQFLQDVTNPASFPFPYFV